MMKNKMMLRMMVTWLVIVLTGGLLAACTQGSGSSQETPRLLRIATLYGDSNYEGHLRTEFTEIYEYTQQVEVEFVYAVDYSQYRFTDGGIAELDPIEEMMKLMEGPNPPDIVMVDYGQLAKLIENNLLISLDSYISNDNFDLSDFAPTVIEALRDIGNDQLYALAPTFSSSALIYNRDLFTQAGVSFPEDFMSWDEVFDLARRVAHGEGDDRVYGFSFNMYGHDDLFYMLENYTAPLELRMVDDNKERMLVHSDAWKNVVETFAQLYREEVIPDRMNMTWDYTHPYSHNLFLSGKLAMTIVHYGALDEIINANNSADAIDGFERIDWDVVTYPIHNEAPEVGGAISMGPIMSINARAQNVEGAWDFIKFINSEEWAKLKSRSSYQLVTRISYNEPKGGLDYNMDAFFALKPPKSSLNEMYMTIPNFWELVQIGQMKFNQVVQDEKTVEEALAEWQTEGDMMLQRQGDEDMDDPFVPLDEFPIDEIDESLLDEMFEGELMEGESFEGVDMTEETEAENSE